MSLSSSKSFCVAPQLRLPNTRMVDVDTVLGGNPVHPDPTYPDLNETFTVHATNTTTYGKCVPSGPAEWTVTRELSYLEGSSLGLCQTRIFEGGSDGAALGVARGRRLLGTFLHNCTTMTQITLEADADGTPQCGGCRCCDSCDPPSLCLPP
jgi:hypothetical protein